METVFKGLKGYPGYMISSDGRIFNGGIEINRHQNGRGYFKVFINYQGERISKRCIGLLQKHLFRTPTICRW